MMDKFGVESKYLYIFVHGEMPGTFRFMSLFVIEDIDIGGY